MAIGTLDGVVAGMQPVRHFAKALTGTLVAGRPQSLWPLAGAPGAGVWNATINGANLSSTSAIPNGAIPHVNPVTGLSYLARLSASSSAQAGLLLLCDRLWQNQLTINSTGAQSITQPTLEARDVSASTDGDGVLLAIEHNAAGGAQAAAATVSYTNQAGTAGRSASILDATAATATISGAFFRMGLQAGDTGVRSVQSITFSTAWTTGTIGLVAYRVLASIELPAAGVGNSLDALTSALQRLPDGVVPFFVFIPSATTTTSITGTYAETQG